MRLGRTRSERSVEPHPGDSRHARGHEDIRINVSLWNHAVTILNSESLIGVERALSVKPRALHALL